MQGEVAILAFGPHRVPVRVTRPHPNLHRATPCERAVILSKMFGIPASNDTLSDAWMASGEWQRVEKSVLDTFVPCLDFDVSAPCINLQWMSDVSMPWHVYGDDGRAVRLVFSDGSVDEYYAVSVRAHRIFGRPSNLQRLAIRASAGKCQPDINRLASGKRVEWLDVMDMLESCRGSPYPAVFVEYNVRD